MKLACIGTGFVGVVTSTVFAKLGHDVIALDIDESKVKSLSDGKVPFFEPGLEELLQETLQSGKLKFTTSYDEAISNAEIIMIMVGTPSAQDGQADTTHVLESIKSLAPFLQEHAIVVIKSTVPPGTNEKVEELLTDNTKRNFTTASVPEFLKEGTAVDDTLHPNRALLGVSDDVTFTKLEELHKPLTDNILRMKPESAQMAKYAANTYLAQRITFINQIANLCEKNGADIEEVILGIGIDKRIGTHYWYPGLGYGGSCFPKDVKEIASYARAIGEVDSLFIKIDQLNEERIPKLMEKYEKIVGGFKDKTIAILGLSFKPNTNDTRESPSLKVIPWLIDHGANIRATDPEAIMNIQSLLPNEVIYAKDAYEAISGAEITILLVEWDEYKDLDLGRITVAMQGDKYFIDTRNQYTKEKVEQNGMSYIGIGR